MSYVLDLELAATMAELDDRAAGAPALARVTGRRFAHGGGRAGLDGHPHSHTRNRLPLNPDLRASLSEFLAACSIVPIAASHTRTWPARIGEPSLLVQPGQDLDLGHQALAVPRLSGRPVSSSIRRILLAHRVGMDVQLGRGQGRAAVRAEVGRSSNARADGRNRNG